MNETTSDNPMQAAENAGGTDPTPEVEHLRAQCDELEQKYLRAVADYQNLARRSSQNVLAERDETRMRMARELITVMDHFDHALEVDLERTSTQDLLRGVQIVRDELLRVLEQFGVRRLEAEIGGEFDPNRHEALMRQSVEGLAPDMVAQQFQVGYTLGDKTLRPAKVAVSE